MPSRGVLNLSLAHNRSLRSSPQGIPTCEASGMPQGGWSCRVRAKHTSEPALLALPLAATLRQRSRRQGFHAHHQSFRSGSTVIGCDGRHVRQQSALDQAARCKRLCPPTLTAAGDDRKRTSAAVRARARWFLVVMGRPHATGSLSSGSGEAGTTEVSKQAITSHAPTSLKLPGWRRPHRRMRCPRMSLASQGPRTRSRRRLRSQWAG